MLLQLLEESRTDEDFRALEEMLGLESPASENGRPPDPEPDPAPAGPEGLSPEQLVDCNLAAQAIAKNAAGIKPTTQEQAALRRISRKSEEQERWHHYRTIPQKHWREMSGRQAKVINEQAARYDLPFAGPFVDLPELVKALHDLLATHKFRLATDPTPEEPDELTRERTLTARLKRLEAEKQLLPRGFVREFLQRLAAHHRRFGDRLQKQFGNAAHDMFERLVADVGREMDRFLNEIEATDE